MSTTLPLTYDECRARFRRAVSSGALPHVSRPIAAPGPDGQQLSIDLTWVGSERPRRALVVMSGVHGVEGFVGSALQVDLLDRLDPARLPGDTAVVIVHAVNPWGMAWWRRQNESNVDLNRNWARDRVAPPADVGYAELHDLLCPGGARVPDDESFLEGIRTYVESRGIDWVRTAISAGQYTHADGLYFGGDRVEESTVILGDLAAERLEAAESVLTLDLHTGHGRYGEPTILSDQPQGSAGDRWVRDRFGSDLVETTVGNPGSTSATKVGQLGHGLAELVPDAEYHSFTLEIGTLSDTRMILAERSEHWVYRHGDRTDPEHAAVVWHHRSASTPDDPEWVAAAMGHGRSVLDRAVETLRP